MMISAADPGDAARRGAAPGDLQLRDDTAVHLHDRSVCIGQDAIDHAENRIAGLSLEYAGVARRQENLGNSAVLDRLPVDDRVEADHGDRVLVGYVAIECRIALYQRRGGLKRLRCGLSRKRGHAQRKRGAAATGKEGDLVRCRLGHVRISREAVGW